MRSGFNADLLAWAAAASRRLAASLSSRSGRAVSGASTSPRRALVHELATSVARLHQLCDALTCGVVVRDAAGRIVHANPAVGELLGVPYATLLGRTTAELPRLWHEDGTLLAESADVWRTAQRTGREIRKVTARLPLPDGGDRWLQLDHIPLVGLADPNPTVITCLIDITERKRAAEELRFRQILLEAQVEASADGILVVSMTGEVVCCNQRFVTLWRLPADVVETHSAIAILEAVQDQVLDSGQFAARAMHLHGLPDSSERSELRLTDGRVLEQYTAPVRGADGMHHGRVWYIRDITERRHWEKTLEHQALHDGLTDLPNRTLLHDRLQQSILTSLRESRPLALLIMDLDRFKDVNDTRGHETGDLLLQLVARRLRASVRASDTVARLGGDEFAFILPITNTGEAVGAAGKLLEALDQPFWLDGQQILIGASIGISLCPEHGTDAASLLRLADLAMYVAKRTTSGFALYVPSREPSKRKAPCTDGA